MEYPIPSDILASKQVLKDDLMTRKLEGTEGDSNKFPPPISFSTNYPLASLLSYANTSIYSPQSKSSHFGSYEATSSRIERE